MIASTSDKKEYVETIRGLIEPLPSHSQFFKSPQYSFGTFDKRDLKSIDTYRLFLVEQVKEIKNPRSLTQKGDFYLFRQNYRKAIKFYLEALEIDPKYLLAYEKIIFAYITHKKFEEAEPYFKKLLNLTNKRLSVFRNYAGFRILSISNNKDNIQETLEIIKEIILKIPDDLEMLNSYGFIEVSLNNNTKIAKEYFEKVLEIDSEYVHSLNNLGICLLRDGEFQKAEKLFKKVIDLNKPDYPYGYQNLAGTYINHQKNKEALSVLKTATENKIRLESHWNHQIGWLEIQVGNFKEAKEWYLEKIKEEPKNNLLLNNLGFCYRALNEIEKAEECYKKAISIFEFDLKMGMRKDTRSLIAYYNLARLAIDKGNFELVREISKKILSIKKDDAFGVYLSGTFFLMTKQYLRAKEKFEEALSIDKKIPEVYPDYSFILESIERDYTKAIDLLNQGLSLGFKSLYIYNNLAVAYIESGKIEEAEKVLNEFKNEPHYTMIATFGLLEARKGNIELANEYYDLAVSYLGGESKKIATQIKYYENALYFFQKEEILKAKEYISLATQTILSSYLNDKINELKEEIRKLELNDFKK